MNRAHHPSWAPPTSTFELQRRCLRKVPAIASMMLALFLLGGMSIAQAALSITSATWNGSRLVVQGTDGKGGAVEVFYGYDLPPLSTSLGIAFLFDPPLIDAMRKSKSRDTVHKALAMETIAFPLCS